MNLKDILKELTEADAMGGLFGALEVAEKYLKEINTVIKKHDCRKGDNKND